MDNETVALVIVIAIAIAVISEIAKSFVKLTAEQIHLLNLALGVVGGIIAMQIFGGDFASNIYVGVTGGIAAPGIYELATKLFKLKLPTDL